MILADALVTALRDWGVKQLFGVSGANIEHVHDAVHRLGAGRLTSVFAKSEVGAAFMADGHARVHRTLGVCCATSGGGMMNLAVGVAESFAESVPVLAIVGQPPTTLEGCGAFQDSSGVGRSVDGVRFWSSISKYCAKLTDAARFWDILEEALRTAQSGRPGPAVMLIPRDLYSQEVGPRPATLPKRLADLATRKGPSVGELDDLMSAVRAAERPAMILGSGVDRCSDPGAVAAFARRVGMKVATTLSSKASFPSDDPLYLGTAGMAGEPSTHEQLAQADLIVAVGTGLNVMTRHPLTAALAPRRLAIINIDLGEATRFIEPAIAIEADAGEVFANMNQRCDAEGVLPRRSETQPSTRYLPQLAPQLPAPDWRVALGPTGGGELLQSDALELLQQYVPSPGHVLFDAGNCAVAALHYLRIPRGTTANIALGMGGMGYSLGAAIGAQMGSPVGTRTMVLCGDGAFLMAGMEVHTAVHYQLPILFVVFNNNMHGMCVTRQQLYFDGRIECSRYPDVSVAGVARGLGAGGDLWVASAGSEQELAARLTEFQLQTDRPGVLELRLAREQVPPFTPFLPTNAETFAIDSQVGCSAVWPVG